MAVESVAGCAWNGWSDHRGIGGQMLMEWVVGWPWNPQPDQQSRKKWGAYMCRRGDNVQPVRDAFLLRDDGARLDVSRVPAGVCLGFGAEIQQPDGQWEKIRQLHLVEHRSATSITLRRVDEWEVPGHPELASDPTLAYLLDELARTREHVKRLEAVVQSLIPPPH